MGRDIIQQPCRRINIQGSADNYKNIGRRGDVDSCLYHRYRLAEPNDKRPQLAAVCRTVAYFHFPLFRAKLTDVLRVVRFQTRRDFRQLAVQVNHFRTAGTLMQVVYVLRDDRHIVILLHGRQQHMSPAWLYLLQLTAAFIIKTGDQLRIAGISFGSGHILHRIAIPQPS